MLEKVCERVVFLLGLRVRKELVVFVGYVGKCCRKNNWFLMLNLVENGLENVIDVLKFLFRIVGYLNCVV